MVYEMLQTCVICLSSIVCVFPVYITLSSISFSFFKIFCACAFYKKCSHYFGATFHNEIVNIVLDTCMAPEGSYL